jgi:group I intron endonuclease
MDLKSNIYVFTNKINGKQYVGQTINIEDRYKQHRKDAKNKDKRPNSIFYKAIRKYGFDSFDFKVLETDIDISKIHEREKFWIKELNTMKPNGYNLTEGGEGTFGYRHTEESKKRMSEMRKGVPGKPKSEDVKKYLSELYKGRKLSEEQKKKISESKKGKRLSEEHKMKISETQKGRTHSEEHNRNVSLGLLNMDPEKKSEMIRKAVETKKANGMDFAKHFREMDEETKKAMYETISKNNPRSMGVKGTNLETGETYEFHSVGSAGKFMHENYNVSVNARNQIRRALSTTGKAYNFNWEYI